MAENLKSKAWWLLLRTEEKPSDRRVGGRGGFFIPVIQCQHLQLFFSWETDTCFIAYLHSWIAETSNKQTCLSVWQSPDMESVTEENSKSHSHGIPSASPLLYFISLWLRKSYHNMKSAGSGQFVGFTEKFRLRFRGTRWILLACGALTLTRFCIDKFLCLGVSLAPCQTGGGCSDGLNTS